MPNIGCQTQITPNIGSQKYQIRVSEYNKDRVSKYLGLECQNLSNIGFQIYMMSNKGSPKYQIRVPEYDKDRVGCQNILDQSVRICQIQGFKYTRRQIKGVQNIRLESQNMTKIGCQNISDQSVRICQLQGVKIYRIRVSECVKDRV